LALTAASLLDDRLDLLRRGEEWVVDSRWRRVGDHDLVTVITNEWR
jgi:hypothetical protein